MLWAKREAHRESRKSDSLNPYKASGLSIYYLQIPESFYYLRPRSLFMIKSQGLWTPTLFMILNGPRFFLQ